jgi:PPOX class probable F420-dependent enzyme
MRLTSDDARERFAASRVARLATITADGWPHVVPICFVVAADTVYSAVDEKPKRSAALKRLANVAANDAVSLLVDHYDDEWSRLWWVRADGRARVVSADSEEHVLSVAALRHRYEQYASHSLADAVLAVDVSAWTGWAASDTHPAPGR